MERIEHKIPEGYEARIDGDKVIMVPKESEDEKIMNDIMVAVENSRLPYERIEEIRFYLNNHKEQKPESCDCSRDEESYTNGIHHVLMNPEAYGLIKQQPAEWSEEDEKIRQDIENLIIFALKEGSAVSPAAETTKEQAIDWLKSLRPQPHWKPSEEQMEALRIAYEIGTANESWAMCVLKSLYNDLKKLM